MNKDWILLLPGMSSVVYVFGVVLIKQALVAGATQRQVNVITNVVIGLLFQPYWFFVSHVDIVQLLKPALCAGFFFLGQVMTFLALRHGDVSVATPLMGTKVVMTALFASLVFREWLPLKWWIAATAATVGIFLVTGATLRTIIPRLLRHDAVSALTAGAMFALTDVFIQKWVHGVGLALFLATMFAMLVVLTLVFFLPGKGMHVYCVPRKAQVPLGFASVLLGLQSMGIGVSISLYGNATAVNVVYSLRSVWSVLMAWALAHFWHMGAEREMTREAMMCRLVGSVLLFTAVIMVLV